MAVTKEEVLARAKELGLSLSDQEVERLVKAGELPKSADERREEMKAKFTVDQLVNMVIESRSEAAARRIEAREATEKLTGLQTELDKNKVLVEQAPQLKAQLEALIEAEKNRRTSAVQKIDEGRRPKVEYLLDVTKVSADQFDTTLEMLIEKKGDGTQAPPPGTPPEGANPFSKKTLNIAEQVRLSKEDPARAKKLADAAAAEK